MPPPDGGVRFENQGEEFGSPPDRSGGFNLSALFVKWGLVSSVREAQYVLLAITIVAVLVGVFFFYSASTGNDVPTEPVYYGAIEQ